MSVSFIPAVQKLQSLLQGDNDLKTFCMSKWKNSPMVKIMFKKRGELLLPDLPVIYITRPRKSMSTVKGNVHIANLFHVFHQPDRELGGTEAILFEEAITNLLLKNRDLLGNATYVEPTEAVNDEGYFHPVYAGLINLEIGAL